MSNKSIALAWLAEQFVGTVETKPNGGPMVERFQRAVDGVASGEPWCVAFVQFCTLSIDDLFGRLAVISQRHRLPPTEWSVGLWRMATPTIRRTVPQVGDIVVWQRVDDQNRGHAGIVIAPAECITVEANTGPTVAGNQREGDGVWRKQRPGFDIPGFQRLGFISPWG